MRPNPLSPIVPIPFPVPVAWFLFYFMLKCDDPKVHHCVQAEFIITLKFSILKHISFLFPGTVDETQIVFHHQRVLGTQVTWPTQWHPHTYITLRSLSEAMVPWRQPIGTVLVRLESNRNRETTVTTYRKVRLMIFLHFDVRSSLATVGPPRSCHGSSTVDWRSSSTIYDLKFVRTIIFFLFCTRFKKLFNYIGQID